MTPKKILISGGTGLIGRAITKHLSLRGYQVGILSRSTTQTTKELPFFLWDVENQQMDVAALHWADAIIHLAGAGVVDKPWTAKRRKVILESRTRSTGLLIDTIRKKGIKMPLFISASAIGYYGADAGFAPTDENSSTGTDFLAKVTSEWEKSLFEADLPETRKVAVRIGIVLSKDGGALPRIAAPIRFGFGAPLGSGKQLMSWIHIHDLCRVFQAAVERNFEGAYNACVPKAISNSDFTKAVAKVLKKPLWMPNVPSFVMKLLMGKRAEIVLGGANILPKKLLNEQFSFEFSNIETALQNIYE